MDELLARTRRVGELSRDHRAAWAIEPSMTLVRTITVPGVRVAWWIRRDRKRRAPSTIVSLGL